MKTPTKYVVGALGLLLIAGGGLINPPESQAGLGVIFRDVKNIMDDVRQTSEDTVEVFKDGKEIKDIVEGEEEQQPKIQQDKLETETGCDLEVDPNCPSN